MELKWSIWSLSGVYVEYVESKWSPCGSVGECKIQSEREDKLDLRLDSEADISLISLN